MGGEVLPFWENIEFWREPMLAAIITAISCGFIGIYVVLKRVVFVAAALSQIASVGVVVAYWILVSMGIMEGETTSFFLKPFFMSFVFVIIGAFLLSFESRSKRITQESIVGFVYLIASAFVLLIGSQIPQGSHDINNILFGNAVAVELSQVELLALVSFILFVIHIIFYKEFIFVSFDKDTAQSLGIPTTFFNILLMVSIGVLIAVATRTIGALPVFSFVVLPPIVGLLLANSIITAFVISIIIGILSATFGYYLSWIWQLPTGATMSAVSAIFVILASILRYFK